MITDMKSWLGIDFSGDYRRWAKGCKRTNIWIAEVKGFQGDFRLKNLFSVQSISEDFGEEPFERLVNFLKEKNFESAGIDAPFSIPEKFMPSGGYNKLLEEIQEMPLRGKPFPAGNDFVIKIAGRIPQSKTSDIYRETERYWLKEGINLRPALWAKGRPGAPMTSACLKLIALRGSPVWPWDGKGKKRLLVEAFPLAQLKVWVGKHKPYSKPENFSARKEIIAYLKSRVSINPSEEDEMVYSADALDAVIAVFAGIAVKENKLVQEPDYKISELEGWIAVHR